MALAISVENVKLKGYFTTSNTTSASCQGRLAAGRPLTTARSEQDMLAQDGSAQTAMREMRMGKGVFLTVLLASVLACPVGLSAGQTKDRATSHSNEGQGPKRVHFFVFMLDIYEIDGPTQSFTANVYVRLRWKDKSLAHSETSARIFPLDGVWNPRVSLANPRGVFRKSLPEMVRVKSDGTVIYHQRYFGPLAQPLRLTEFPMDRQRFLVQFASAGYTPDEVVFVPDVLASKGELAGGGISSDLSLPDWDIVEHQSLVRPYEPTVQVRSAGFALEFKAKRRVFYYFLQVIVPLSLIVAMSWTAFWIDPGLISTQVGVATSSILSLVAYRFVLAGLLPRLHYMTRMDYFVLGSTLLVFLALIEVILTSFLHQSSRDGLARKIDRISRLAFPVVFLLILGGLMFG